MIEQTSTAVKFLAMFLASKVGAAGLTVTVDVYNPAGTKIVSDAAAVEIGGGLYSYTLSGSFTAAEGGYVAVFKTADTTVAQKHIPALWEIGVAGIEALETIGSGVVTLVSPLSQDLRLTIQQGDSYLDADARALTWTDSGGTWPSLAGGAVVFKTRNNSTQAVFTKAGTVVDANTARVELTAAETAARAAGGYAYEIQATLSNGSIVTLAAGAMNVRADL